MTVEEKETKTPLLQIERLGVSFPGTKAQAPLAVLSELSLQVHAGEIVAVVGASGSGKSILASAILGLLPPSAMVSGKIFYKGKPVDSNTISRLCGRELTLIPQTVSHLDPLMKIGKQLGGRAKKEARRALFLRLGLPEQTDRLYPHALSGGMTRRVLAASAMLSDACVILADEPTPGMSREQAKETLRMLRELAAQGRGVLLITHELELAMEAADRIAVCYAGQLLEIAPAAAFLQGPAALSHPFSVALWRALPEHEFAPIPGTQPYAGSLPAGCVFAPRCEKRTARCLSERPPMVADGCGEVRCFHAT